VPQFFCSQGSSSVSQRCSSISQGCSLGSWAEPFAGVLFHFAGGKGDLSRLSVQGFFGLAGGVPWSRGERRSQGCSLTSPGERGGLSRVSVKGNAGTFVGVFSNFSGVMCLGYTCTEELGGNRKICSYHSKPKRIHRVPCVLSCASASTQNALHVTCCGPSSFPYFTMHSVTPSSNDSARCRRSVRH
jgi:hypothetical protein